MSATDPAVIEAYNQLSLTNAKIANYTAQIATLTTSFNTTLGSLPVITDPIMIKLYSEIFSKLKIILFNNP